MNALYDVFVVKKNETTEDQVAETLRHHGAEANDVLFVRQCIKSGKSDTYIVCMKKDLGTKLMSTSEEKPDSQDMTVIKYSVNRETLQYGQTWGYYIKCDVDTENSIEELFKNFELHGFIHQGTYQLKKPKNQDGSRKPYIIITFKKKNDRYPKQFIRKLKGLIDYKTFNGKSIKVNWIKYNNRSDTALNTEPQVQAVH